jgi:hypothetical protein
MLGLAVLSAAAFAQRSAPTQQQFLAQASVQLGIPAVQLELGRIDGPIQLHDAGLDLFVASAVRGDTAKTVVALDADGRVFDWQLALAADKALSSLRGKMDRRLLETIEASPLGARFTVALWIDAPSIDDVREGIASVLEELDERGELTRELAEFHQLELARQISARIAPATAACAAELGAAGFDVLDHDALAPIVFVSADAAQLAELNARSNVRSIDYAGQQYDSRLNVAVPEAKGNSVWTAPGGVTGVGAKVSIVESTRVGGSAFMTVAATKTPGGSIGTHTTGVGSCVASTNASCKGIAPGATVISANGADFTTGTTNVTNQMPGSVSAVSWSVAQGAQIMNLSYGAGNPGSTVSSFDKYLDYIVRNSAKTVVIACGNSGTLAGYAGDPGAGFNQLAVGNFNDNGGSAWSGETIASSSSWKNPSTGVETPQVAAPGTNITMLSSGGTCSYTDSGTSFSSPLTAGECALLVAKQPGLGGWPEPVRAIVMATAWHNIEGVATLSSKDGAGGIDALAAFKVAARGKGPGYNYGSVVASSFDAAGMYTAQASSASAGQTVRVCLSWDSTPSAGPTYSPDVLKADLDLYVYGPTGALVASSVSGIQPFEVVQFTAPQSGTYTVKIKKFSFTGTSEYWGTAFTTSADI